jgi:hypothetical protein
LEPAVKDKPKLPYYELEFSSDATFWTVGDASTRRIYLMPVPIPSEFLAFGVLDPDNTAVFVARGRVREELGSFIARMVQDGARVELYAEAPLPKWLVDLYIKGPPHEGKEYEEPPPQPTPGAAPTKSSTTTQKTTTASGTTSGTTSGT